MDAACGPSNALQSFQKHAQQDRTLQQDRFNLRHASSQGFRSSPGPNAGLIDPEFEAFQAGMSSGPMTFQPAPMQQFAPQPVQSQYQPQASIPDWASDFQNSHSVIARPGSSQQIAAPIPMHAPAAIVNAPSAASWHTDFMQSQNVPVFEPQAHMISESSWVHDTQMSMGYGPMMSGGLGFGQGLGLSAVAQGKQREQEPSDMFDMAAFEQAFDDARVQMLEAETALQSQVQEQQMGQTILNDDELSDLERELQEETDMLAAQAEREMQWQNSRHGSPQLGQAAWPDTFMAEQHRILDEATRELPDIVDQTVKEQQPLDQPSDDNELSVVAGQLLDSVSDNQSKKFQASSFLQLMRRLRDKELRVEGENFVETGYSTRSQSPSQSPSTTSAPTFATNAVLERSERIAAALADLDNDPEFAFASTDSTMTTVDDSYVIPEVPSRIPTPEIDPPGPSLDEWRARVLGTPEPQVVNNYAFDAINPFGF